ncbi:CU044_2847 family protein [Micromonospora sp. NPDC005553]|uniref:CU044_2847 family protein n=1 Tax=Micromonospora sp. NPDC005553 TaxID=3364232 RepID=UPI0036CBB910
MEIDQPDGGPVKVGREKIVSRATQTFQDALDPIIRMATGVTDKLRESNPGEISVAFGVKFTAESGIVLSKIASEANLTVTVQWDTARPPAAR